MIERKSNLDFKKELEARTRRFASAVFRMLNDCPKNVATKVIAYQLGKSASSIGANYREANRAESTDDFIHKIGIVLKETSETVYWLEVLQDVYPDAKEISLLLDESRVFLSLYQKINRTAKQNSGRIPIKKGIM